MRSKETDSAVRAVARLGHIVIGVVVLRALWTSVCVHVDLTEARNRWTLGVLLDGKLPGDPAFPAEIHSASGYIEP
jgi:hypothetical protein